jgi:hypothetical protein
MDAATAQPTCDIVIEKDVDIPMRDGVLLKADVLRPDNVERFPTILNLGPYQKDKLGIPPDNLEEKPNPLMNSETVNPQRWVPKGYVCNLRSGRCSAFRQGHKDASHSLHGIKAEQRCRMGRACVAGEHPTGHEIKIKPQCCRIAWSVTLRGSTRQIKCRK